MTVRVDKEEYEGLVSSSKEMTLSIEEYESENSILKKKVEELECDVSDLEVDLSVAEEIALEDEATIKDLESKLKKIPKIVQKMYGVKI